METEFKINLEGTTLNVYLGRDLAKKNAPALQDLLGNYRGQDIRKIVFDATDLVFLSSAGVRCIIFARQDLGQKPEIVFVNCAKEIHEVFHITGMFRFITFVEDERKTGKNKNTVGVMLHPEPIETKQGELDDFAAKNDVVCLQMRLGEEE